MPPPLTTTNRLVLRASGVLLVGLMAFVGIGAFWNGLRLLREGDPNTAGAVTAVVLGAIITAAAGALGWWNFVGRPARAALRRLIQARYPGQPWMERADWARRRITTSTGTPALLSWVWVVGWCGFIGLIATVNRAKIAAELATTWSIWVMLAILAVGTLIGITFAWNFTLHWLRYGRSTLTLDTLPGRPGELFKATLSAALPRGTRPDVDVHLVCEEVRWVKTGYGSRRRTRLQVDRLGATSTRVPGQRGAATSRGFVIPLEIQVPDGLPDSGKDDGGNGVQWRLEVATPTGYAASFEVPIYRIDQAT